MNLPSTLAEEEPKAFLPLLNVELQSVNPSADVLSCDTLPIASHSHSLAARSAANSPSLESVLSGAESDGIPAGPEANASGLSLDSLSHNPVDDVSSCDSSPAAISSSVPLAESPKPTVARARRHVSALLLFYNQYLKPCSDYYCYCYYYYLLVRLSRLPCCAETACLASLRMKVFLQQILIPPLRGIVISD